MAAVRHLGIFIFSQYSSEFQICTYFYVDMQNLMKIGQSTAKLLRIFDFQNGGLRHLGFYNFRNICQKFKFAPILVKIGRSTAKLLRIRDFQNGGRLPSWILIFLHYLSKIQICAYFYLDMQNLVKIRRSAA